MTDMFSEVHLWESVVQITKGGIACRTPLIVYFDEKTDDKIKARTMVIMVVKINV